MSGNSGSNGKHTSSSIARMALFRLENSSSYKGSGKLEISELMVARISRMFTDHTTSKYTFVINFTEYITNSEEWAMNCHSENMLNRNTWYTDKSKPNCF